MYNILNYKNFAQASIDLFRPVTVLIGNNGSGKSNAIEAIELLANLALGRPLHEITDVGRGVNTFQVRGGLYSCLRHGQSFFGLGMTFRIHFEGMSQPSEYFIQISVYPSTHIAYECLKIGGRNFYQASLLQQKRDILEVTYDNFSRGKNPHTKLPSDKAVLTHYDDLLAPYDLRNRRRKEAKDVVAQVRRYLATAFVFDPNPKSMRGYERIGQTYLLRDGSNLASILYSLDTGSDENKESLGRILGRIKQLPDEPFSSFAFAPTQQHDVLFGLKKIDADEIIDARLLSDGTLRCLAILTALETVPPGSRIVIEEFDNGLHPSRIDILTEAIWETCKRRNLSALLTTHNPATLDALTDEQLKDVIVCYWDNKEKASRLLPLLHIPSSDILRERGQLGNLVTRRILEQHLAPHFEEKRLQQAREWLEALP
jgi:predicted ATPase